MARIRTKSKISAAIRMELAVRYGASKGMRALVACEICGEDGYIDWVIGRTGRGNGQLVFSLEMDHKVPEFLGGETSAANLQFLCRPCNRSKGAN
jgi:5-methylcytosine-specific restriction endonuclease McrA